MRHAPELEKLVAGIRKAASTGNATNALRELLLESVLQPNAIAGAIADISDDELMLFEDSSCSVWSCRYSSDAVFAPHEHCMTAHIAVFRGTEVEVMYRRESGEMRHIGNTPVGAGEVLTLSPDAIHAVTADGTEQSHAIHVYEGPLTQVSRSLYDWNTGAAVEFSMENFHAMKRVKSQMLEFH